MRITLILFIFLFTLGSCQRHKPTATKQNETESASQETIIESEAVLKPNIEKEEQQITIQGIWAENEEENAWYWIEKDSVYFVEHPDNPVPYKYENDTLRIFFEGHVAKDRVIRLTLDSLWIEGDTPTDTIKLYKRN